LAGLSATDDLGRKTLENDMIRECAIVLCVLATCCGCSSFRTERAGNALSQRVQIEVVNAEEHFGHNINESGGHSVWCDGCRTRLVTSGDPFVIYWINNQIKETAYRFKQGQKYTVWFTGDIGSGVMAYRGSCIDLRQVVKLEER
jgi:hypothetical protein